MEGLDERRGVVDRGRRRDARLDLVAAVEDTPGVVDAVRIRDETAEQERAIGRIEEVHDRALNRRAERARDRAADAVADEEREVDIRDVRSAGDLDQRRQVEPGSPVVELRAVPVDHRLHLVVAWHRGDLVPAGSEPPSGVVRAVARRQEGAVDKGIIRVVHIDRRGGERVVGGVAHDALDGATHEHRDVRRDRRAGRYRDQRSRVEAQPVAGERRGEPRRAHADLVGAAAQAVRRVHAVAVGDKVAVHERVVGVEDIDGRARDDGTAGRLAHRSRESRAGCHREVRDTVAAARDGDDVRAVEVRLAAEELRGEPGSARLHAVLAWPECAPAARIRAVELCRRSSDTVAGGVVEAQ